MSGALGPLICLMLTGFDVTRFGAVPDGVTDSTKAIQKAIDAAVEAGGGVVVLPPAPAPYLVRDTLLVRGSDIEIRGSGATIRLADNSIRHAVKNLILVSGTGGVPIRKVTIRGLTVDANYFSQDDARGSKAILFRFVEDALVEDVVITRPYVGLSFRRCVDARAQRVTVTDYEEDALDAGGDADEVSGGKAKGVTFKNVVVRDAPRAKVDGNAFEIEDGAERVVIEDALIDNVAGNGIGMRNHRAEGKMNHSGDIELRNIRVGRIGGAFAVFAFAAPRERTAENSYQGIRLVNVTTKAPVVFWGPVRNLELTGGRYGGIHLGFNSTTDEARTVHGLADARIVGLQAELMRINGASESIALTGVSAEVIQQLAPR